MVGHGARVGDLQMDRRAWLWGWGGRRDVVVTQHNHPADPELQPPSIIYQPCHYGNLPLLLFFLITTTSITTVAGWDVVRRHGADAAPRPARTPTFGFLERRPGVIGVEVALAKGALPGGSRRGVANGLIRASYCTAKAKTKALSIATTATASQPSQDSRAARSHTFAGLLLFHPPPSC